jgi:hypothetical protein
MPRVSCVAVSCSRSSLQTVRCPPVRNVTCPMPTPPWPWPLLWMPALAVRVPPEVEIGHAFLRGEDETPVVVVMKLGPMESKLTCLCDHPFLCGPYDLPLGETVGIVCAIAICYRYHQEQGDPEHYGLLGVRIQFWSLEHSHFLPCCSHCPRDSCNYGAPQGTE